MFFLADAAGIIDREFIENFLESETDGFDAMWWYNGLPLLEKDLCASMMISKGGGGEGGRGKRSFQNRKLWRLSWVPLEYPIGD